MKQHIAVFFCFLSLMFACSLHAMNDTGDSRTIGLIINDDFRGEHELAERIKIASRTLNWNAHIMTINSYKNSNRHYDWILTLVPGKECHSEANDYLVLFDPVHHYFRRNGHLKKMYSNYSGYLLTYNNTEFLLKDIHYDYKRLYPNNFYPTVQYWQHQTVNPTRLFHFIGHWGNRLNDIKYQTLQTELAKKSYADFFGKPCLGTQYGEAFKGSIPYDGESVINIIAESGVCLVLHSETHIFYKIPSGRIFEALAASAVIISDLNPFILEHFGDSVLYVNHELTGEEMFQQIDAHMNWIQNHPEEALKMAKRAHEIFENHFLLESQLLAIDQFQKNQQGVN